MRRQLQPPSHLKVAPGLYGPPRIEVNNVPVGSNQYATPAGGLSAGIGAGEKFIPAIPAIPGFRTSAAFLTSLSANLQIDPDCPSPLHTPLTFRTPNNAFLPPPSPFAFSTIAPHIPYPPPSLLEAEEPTMSALPASHSETAPSSAPTDSLPELTTYTSTTQEERISGLRLVADSVAQQRQTASKMLIYHPLNIAAYILLIGVIAKLMYTSPDDIYMLFTTLGGVTFSCLIAVRWATSRYLQHAETINWDWLGEDRMLVVKWGQEIIGALVLGWADAEAGKKKGHAKRRRGKAVVRAWTVRGKYRSKGIGEGLLEEAVKVAGERGADGIVFADDHANSKRVLPTIYNTFLNKQEARAEKALEKVADEKGNFRQRRSSPTWGSR
ncbi:hypothetical protein DM02DRAFT_536814 [Periconia macrospinosa]|uniref:N-acetyltransferase domain-containing protein n=1 Tax=Periconia macrospinosa TaxID=97972 RepID=A0A2V1DC09_9PLEO|nr:hypothetical protein DM02DRAFT_536814 [Periconia macrospinosa]